MKKLRVLLADDHNLVLEGIKRTIESEFDLVGTAANGLELINTAHRLKPDVIVLDIFMPLLNGMEAARQLRKTLSDAKLIFLTMHEDVTCVAEALRLGVSGYVLKSSTGTELIRAIREVSRGSVYVQQSIGKPCSSQEHQLAKSLVARYLTTRQREVLQLIAEGHSTKQISSLLRISMKTVEFHKYSIMKLLEIHTIAELTKYAVRHGLTEA